MFNYLQRMILVGMSRDVEYDLRNVYFAALEKQAPGFFHDYPTGDLMARATNDLQAVRMLCGPAIMYMAGTICTAAGALFFMTRISVSLMLIALAPMPLVVFATTFIGRRIHGLFTSVQGKFSDVTSKVQENLAGVRVVRAYAREAHEDAEFERVNERLPGRQPPAGGLSTAFQPLLQIFVGLGFAAVLMYGGLLVIRNRISVGEFVTFHLFLGRLIWPMIAIGWVVNLTQRGTASLARIRKILDTQPAIRDEEPLVDPGAHPGGCELPRPQLRLPRGGAGARGHRPAGAGGADGGGGGPHRLGQEHAAGADPAADRSAARHAVRRRRRTSGICRSPGCARRSAWCRRRRSSSRRRSTRTSPSAVPTRRSSR